jgi:pimeloyl-ACP methyl ester carboxylesterase
MRIAMIHATSSTPRICAAHTSEAFGQSTAELLAEVAGIDAVCVAGRGASEVPLEDIVDEIEATRQELGVAPWIFWGMSGGGWLALLYARRHPEGLAGIVVESACACFRARLGDPTCVLSPSFAMWRERLGDRIDPHAHDEPSDVADARWESIEGLGEIWCRSDGTALLVSPMALDDRMKQAMPRVWAFDARPWIGELRVPTLVIAGDRDPVVPMPRVRAVHEAIAGSRWLVAEGGGHVPTAARHPAIAPAARALVDRVLR